MVSKKDLKIIDHYELLGESRFRVCVQGTNLVINVKAETPEEALDRALEVLSKIGLDEESHNKLKSIVRSNVRC